MTLTREKCSRPGCDNALNTGALYCSPRCAALARSEGKARQSSLSHRAQELIPQEVANTLVYHLGDDAYPVLNEWAVTLAERSTALPPLMSKLTDSGDEDADYGFLNIGGAQYRSNDALSFDVIKQMLRNGQVSFGLKMKTAWLLSVFRNDRSWDIECKDEKTVNIVKPLVSRVLTRHSGEFIEALSYGAYFGEKVWDAQPAVQWGIAGVGDGEMVYGYKTVRPCHPKSIDRILYRDELTAFDGFVQNKASGGMVTVPPELALVLTYDKRWRNLWGNPVLDCVYPLWFWYEIALRSFLRYLERMGTPVTVCEAPSKGEVYTPDGTKMRSMKYALIVAGHVGKSSAIALPSDVDDQGNKLWKVAYLADDKRGAQFVEALNQLGTLILRGLIIGDRAVVQGETGSYAAAARHFAVTMLHNEFILTQFVNQFNSYLIPQLVEYNVGANAAPAVMVTEGLDPDEKDRLFNLLNTIGNQAGATSMDYIDWQRIFAIENIPVLSKEDYEALQEEKQKKAEEAMLRQQQIGGPGRPPQGQKPQPDEEQQPAQEKARVSAEWVLHNTVRGRGFPLMLTTEQADEIVDRFRDRPTVFVLEDSAGLTSQELEKVKEELFKELKLPAAVDGQVRDVIWAMLLRELMGEAAAEPVAQMEFFMGSESVALLMSDPEIVALGIGEWLKNVVSKAKSLIKRVVKAVTGKVAEWKEKAWQRTVQRAYEEAAKRGVGTVVIVDSKGRVWSPEEHPRDEQGRFKEKGADETGGGEAVAEPVPEEFVAPEIPQNLIDEAESRTEFSASVTDEQKKVVVDTIATLLGDEYLGTSTAEIFVGTRDEISNLIEKGLAGVADAMGASGFYYPPLDKFFVFSDQMGDLRAFQETAVHEMLHSARGIDGARNLLSSLSSSSALEEATTELLSSKIIRERFGYKDVRLSYPGECLSAFRMIYKYCDGDVARVWREIQAMHAAGNAPDYVLRMMPKATGGRYNIIDEVLVRNLIRRKPYYDERSYLDGAAVAALKRAYGENKADYAARYYEYIDSFSMEDLIDALTG